MKRLLSLLLGMSLILVACGGGSTAKIEKFGKYEISTDKMKFDKFTEQERLYFEKKIENKDLLNSVMGIYQNAEIEKSPILGFTSEELSFLVDKIVTYYEKNDFNINQIKLIFAVSIFNYHNDDHNIIYEDFEEVYSFIDFMENHEYEYTEKNIDKWDAVRKGNGLQYVTYVNLVLEKINK